VSVLLWSLQQIVTMTANVAPNAWRRHLEILLAGISNRPRQSRTDHSVSVNSRPRSMA